MDIVEILDRYSAGDEFQRPVEAAIEEITTLRQRVQELETQLAKNNPLLDEAADAIDKLTAERDALKQQRDELLAALEELSLYVAYNGDDWVQKKAKAAIASVKEKA